MAKLKNKKCRHCGTEFRPGTAWAKYCSIRCRSAVQNARNRKFVKLGKKALEEREKESA